MPIVPRYGDRKVQTEALPGVRKSAAETPTSTGAGLDEANQQTGEALMQVGAQGARMATAKVAEIHQGELKQQYDLVDLAAANQLAKATSDIHSQALSVQGKDTLALHDSTASAFNDAADGIEAGLPDARAREAFARIRSQHDVNLYNAVGAHTEQQMKAYRASELGAAINLGLNAAVANALDDHRGAQELQGVVKAIAIQGPALGWGEQEIRDRQAKALSTGHLAILHRLFDNQQLPAARDYYAQISTQIDGGDRGPIEKALALGSAMAEGQKLADAIQAGGGTLTEQLAKARDQASPEVREHVEQRLKQADAVKEKQQRDTEEATLVTAYTTVDKTHDVASIPPSTWALLPGPQRAALRGYAISLAKGTPVQTDLGTYYSRMQLAGTNPEAFMKLNLMEDRHRLDEGDFKHLTGLQLSLRSGDNKKADQDLEGFRTHSEIVEGTLDQYGFPPKKDRTAAQENAVAQLLRMVDRRVEAAQGKDAQGKRTKVTNVERQQALDDILSVNEKTPGSWWGLIPFTSTKFSDTNHRLLDTTIDQVPAADRTAIEKVLRRNGRPVSDALILNEYLEQQFERKVPR